MRRKILCFGQEFESEGFFTKDKKDAKNAAAKMALRSLEECENSTLQWCKMPRLVKVFILGRGVVFTSEVGMTRVNRRWKAYPARNKDK